MVDDEDDVTSDTHSTDDTSGFDRNMHWISIVKTVEPLWDLILVQTQN